MKRTGDRPRVSLRDTLLPSVETGLDLVDLEDALAQLAALDSRAARVVDLRFCLGLTVQETAEIMGTSTASVERGWRDARAWLAQQLGVERQR